MSPCQQSLYTDVLIQIRPLNRVTVTQELQILSLCGRGIEQTRIPGQWHVDRAAICKVQGQFIVCDPYFSDAGFHFKH